MISEGCKDLPTEQLLIAVVQFYVDSKVNNQKYSRRPGKDKHPTVADDTILLYKHIINIGNTDEISTLRSI